ncbi:hypothetical protein E1301_Tti010506 [Triplophysa tibetana]|uniref:Uncharacterized protein n=1 Tax=Triplophysa tibetana TaxID=1572043 RepID=A0A5A9NEU1_9TELE|nr:hypothetical protein E1301_Tti010506 [Triplophysa tibetana]
MCGRVQLQEKEKILPAKKRLFLLFLFKFHSYWPLAPFQRPMQKESLVDGGKDVAIVMWQHIATILVLPRSEEGLVMTSSNKPEEEE